MFTGIIQAIGTVRSVSSHGSGRRIVLELSDLPERVVIGGSLAVNGVCLTASAVTWPEVAFDVVSETLSRTNLGELTPGASVNLELPLKATDRIEGHHVLGHVDTTCTIRESRDEPPSRRIRFEPTDATVLRYIVPKGSVAVDGISLTVADIDERGFAVAIIPETLQRTTLGDKSVSDRVNLETDILVKTVVRQMTFASDDADRRLMNVLAQSGFDVDQH